MDVSPIPAGMVEHVASKLIPEVTPAPVTSCLSELSVNLVCYLSELKSLCTL